MTRPLQFTTTALLVAGLAGPALASDPVDDAPAPEATVTEESSESVLSASAGVDFGNQYWFRGIVQETTDFIAQPWFEVGVGLYSGSGAFSSVDLSIGLWNSIHTGPTRDASTATVRGWYEADVYAGLSVGLFEQVSVDVTYTAYMSPSAVFSTIHELTLGVGWDDSALYESSWFGGLQPSITTGFELDGGADGGAHEGVFMGVGLEPTFTVYDGAVSVGAGLPLEIGFSLSDYYETATGDETFGYVSAGAAVTVGLGLIPESYGAWEIGLAITALVLGDATRVDDDVELLATAGISASL